MTLPVEPGCGTTGNPACGAVISGLSAPSGGGESQRFVPATSVSAPMDSSPRFTPAKDVVGNTINLPYTPDFATGDTVVYSAGGGTPIPGLLDGNQYKAFVSGNSVELCDQNASSCGPGNAITLSVNPSVDYGRSHSIVKKGEQPSADASQENPASVTAGTQTGFHGVAVTATNSDDISAVAVSAGASGSVAVNISGSVNVVSTDTEAYIGAGAHINCAWNTACTSGNTTAGSVKVAAANSFRQLGIAASLSIGGDVGAAPSAAVRVVTLVTKAYIDSNAIDKAIVFSPDSVSVTADNSGSIVSVAAGAGGGTVGVAASGGVTVLNDTTYADTGTNATIDAAGNVLLEASDQTSVISVAGTAAGGFVGVAAGVGVLSITKDTQAFIGGSSHVDGRANTATTISGTARDGSTNGNCSGVSSCFGTLSNFQGVAVQASSSENIFGLAASIGGGAVGVAGAVDVAIAHVDTKAFVGPSAQVNAKGGAGAAQGVDVAAVDFVKTLTIAGGAAGGVVGVGGGVDIGVVDETTQAYLGTGSTVDANGDVNVYALAHEEIQSFAVGFGAGFVGVAGAVSVWTIGTQTVSTYNQAAGGPDRGAWSATNAASSVASDQYHKGDQVEYDPVSASGCDPSTDSNCQVYVASVDDPTTAPTDTGSWQAQQSALDDHGGTGAASLGDQMSGGQGSDGFMSMLQGTTNSSTPSAWSNSTPYNSGDVVSFVDADGHTRYFKATAATTGVQPIAPGSQTTAMPLGSVQSPWEEVTGQYTTNNRISGQVGSQNGTCDNTPGDTTATNQMACSQKNGSIVSGQLAQTAPPNGTSAEIYGNVTAGRNVNVVAADNLSALGLAGVIAVGAVGVGVGVYVLNVEGSTDAGINSGAQVTAGTAGAVTVRSAYGENILGIAIAGTAGLVAVGGDVVVVNDSSSQMAHIDDSAAILRSGGGVTVSAGCGEVLTDHCAGMNGRTVDALAIGGQGGVVAAGASVAVAELSGDTQALIGDVSFGGTGTVSSITVKADDAMAPQTQAISVGVGLVALGGAVAVTDLSGTTLASSGAHGSISGGMTVAATGDHSNVSAETLNPKVGFATLGLTIRHAVDSRNTEGATTKSATAGAALSAGGAVLVTAQATNHVVVGPIAGIPEISVSGFSLSILVGIAKVEGATEVQLDGSVSGSSSITAWAHGDNQASAPVTMIGASVVGASGAYADAEITNSAKISAIVGSDASLSSGGAIDIEALTANSSGGAVANSATASIESISLSFAASITVMVANASVGGAVEAELDGKVTSSSGITVNANGQNSSTAKVDTISAAFGLGLSGSGAEADITGRAVTSATGASTASLDSSGAILFEATSQNTANASSTSGTGALFAFSINIPKADIAAPTTGEFDGGVSGAGSLTITANSANNSTATSNPVAFGLFSGSGAESEADLETGASTNANVGSGTLSVTSKISLTSTSNNSASASTDGTGAGGLSVSILKAAANDHAGTNASFGATVNQATEIDVDANGTDSANGNLHAISIGLLAGITVSEGDATIDGSNNAQLTSAAKIQSAGTNVSVSDVHVGEATATANGGGGGALGAAKLTANGTDSPTVNSFAAGGATVGNGNGTPGSLTISSNSTEGTNVNSNAGTGGIVSFGGISATSNVSPTVSSYLAGNNVLVSGNVGVTAQVTRAEGHTRATAFGGGAVQIGSANATANVNPAVTAYMGSGSNINAGGSVTIDAENLSQASGPPPGDTFNIPSDVNQATGR